MSELHIKRPINPRFVARVREHGARNYRIVGRNHRTSDAAARAMLKEFMKSNRYKRGDVVMVEKSYEPNQLLEVTR